MFSILVRWKQSNATDAAVKNLLKSWGLIDRGNLGTTASNAELKGKKYKKTKVVDKNPKLMKFSDHVWQFLIIDLFMENHFMIFGKHKDRVIVEILADDKPKQASYFFLCNNSIM